MMIKIVYLWCLLMAITLCVPKSQFDKWFKTCADKYIIVGPGGSGVCEYDIFNNNSVSKPECASDYYRSHVCHSTFDQC